MVKKIAQKLLDFIINIILRLIKIFNKLIFLLSAVNVYLKQNECQKFKDCILLQKLKARQPPCSDRYLEYPWMLKNINIKQGKLLDAGSSNSDLLRAFLPKTVEIHALNINIVKKKNTDIIFAREDLRKTNYPDNYFDCIICISVLEHVGVHGRYGSDNDETGDYKAVKEMSRILKKDGVLLLTVPYGIRDVLPINKLYNKKRIKELFAGFDIAEQKYKKYNKKYNLWLEVSEEEAAETDMIRDEWYAILFVKAIKKG